MKPRVTVLTLGVDDLDRSLHFYRDGLGLRTDGIIGNEFEFGAVAFFQLQSGLQLALWPRRVFRMIGARGFSCLDGGDVGHNVSSKDEVDVVMEEASRPAQRRKTRAETLLRRLRRILSGPDRHLWEVVWNPQLCPPIDA